MPASSPSKPLLARPRPPLWIFGEALLHPLCVICSLLWWGNDNFGKVYWPSWLTGKLSDATSLVAFPVFIWCVFDGLLVLGWGHAWFNRFGWRRALLWSFALGTALLFTVIKLSPSIADAYRAAWDAFYTLVGRALPDGSPSLRATHTLDPTDLFTLPALFGATWVGGQLLRRQAAALAADDTAS